VSEGVFSGVVADGRFLPDVSAPRLVWLGAHEGQRVLESLATVAQRRSTQANRRYWSVVVPVAVQVLSAGRVVPLSKDQAHYVLKYAFIGHEDTPLGPVPKSSKVLTTAEFAAFCQRVEGWLLHQHGVVLDGVDGEGA